MGESSLIIRLCLPHERLEVAELWEDMHKEISPDTVPSKDWWVFKMGGAYVYIVEDEGKAIGFFDAAFMVDPLCETHKVVVHDVYIKPEYRKTKVFKEMLSFLKTEAKINKATAIAGFCKENKKAFWEHMGFKMTGYTMELDI